MLLSGADRRTVSTSRREECQWCSAANDCPHELLFRDAFMPRCYTLKQLEWLNIWNTSVMEMVADITALEQVKHFTGQRSRHGFTRLGRLRVLNYSIRRAIISILTDFPTSFGDCSDFVVSSLCRSKLVKHLIIAFLIQSRLPLTRFARVLCLKATCL